MKQQQLQFLKFFKENKNLQKFFINMKEINTKFVFFVYLIIIIICMASLPKKISLNKSEFIAEFMQKIFFFQINKKI